MGEPGGRSNQNPAPVQQLTQSQTDGQITDLSAVHRAALEILAVRAWYQTLAEIARQAGELCGADSAAVYLTETDGAHLVLSGVAGPVANLLGERVATGVGISGRVAQTGRSLLLPDYNAWEGRIDGGGPWRGTAAAPLLHDGQSVGVLVVVLHTSERQFDDRTLRLLEMLAPAATLAVRNARSNVEQAADLAGAARIARVLSGEPDAQRMREAICQTAIALTGCRTAALLEPSQDGELVGTALASAAVNLVSVRLDEPSASGLAFLSGQPVFIGDTRDDPRCSAEWALSTDTRAILVQPVLSNGLALGVLDMVWSVPQEDLSQWIRSVSTLLANAAAVAIERGDLVRRLDVMARSDALTGVANRRTWEEELPRRLAAAARDRASISVGMLDLDRFKDYNDLQGHQGGDLLLREVAVSWERELRESDLLARYGGEEFAVILPDCELDSAVATVERLRAATPASQTCSAGVACWDGVESPDALLARADTALYEAKLAGRNCTRAAPGPVVTGENDSGKTAGWAHWTGMVPKLLESGAVLSVYQPIVDLADLLATPADAEVATGSIIGYEALARPAGTDARASVEGLFAAAQFRGMGRDLDWICRRAALTGAGHIPAGTPLFVNVGLRALLDPLHAVDQMLLLLHFAGRAPGDVVLEITDREAIRDAGRLAEVLAAYRAEGFRFCIDDVGQGHSTLELLAGAAAEFIKVSRRLMVAGHRPGAHSALEAVVAFARSSGAALIAEGIETHEEAATMLGRGIRLGQGFGLGVPAWPPLQTPTFEVTGEEVSLTRVS